MRSPIALGTELHAPENVKVDNLLFSFACDHLRQPSADEATWPWSTCTKHTRNKHKSNVAQSSPMSEHKKKINLRIDWNSRGVLVTWLLSSPDWKCAVNALYFIRMWCDNSVKLEPFKPLCQTCSTKSNRLIQAQVLSMSHNRIRHLVI